MKVEFAKYGDFRMLAIRNSAVVGEMSCSRFMSEPWLVMWTTFRPSDSGRLDADTQEAGFRAGQQAIRHALGRSK